MGDTKYIKNLEAEISRLDRLIELREGQVRSLQWKLDRTSELRDIAIEQCERRTSERDVLAAAAKRFAGRLVFGETMEDVFACIHRLRSADQSKLGYWSNADELLAGARSELDEVAAEPYGSSRAKAEAVDAAFAAIHLCRAHGATPADIVGLLGSTVAKIHSRLDHIDAGGTWASAKEAELTIGAVEMSDAEADALPDV